MQVGEPIREGWSLYKRFWRHLVPIALVTYLVISLIGLVLQAVAGTLGALASVVVAIVGVFLLQGALVEAVADVRDGRADLTLGQTLQRVVPRLGSIILASILAGFAVAIGFVLLIAPGLYLLTIWSVVIPVIVLEKTGAMDSFGRSRALVRGYGWTVFGVIVVTFLINIVVGIVLAILFAGFSAEVTRYLSDVISNTLISPFIAATWTSMYFMLRQLHEPVDVPSGAAFSEE